MDVPRATGVIVDAADPRLALYAGVRDPVLAREAGCFVAEGRFVVRRLIESGRYRIRSVLLTPTAAAQLGNALTLLPADVPVWLSELDVVRAVTGFNLDRGCLALAERPEPAPWRQVVAAARDFAPLLVAEHVGNPDNIGSLFRNAAAFGAAAVLLSPGCADPFYRKVVRTSMAASLAMPSARLEPWPAALADMQGLGWHVAALVPRGDMRLDDWARAVADRPRVAVLVGHEGEGLTETSRRQADATVRIPMAPGADSVNVAVAAAIALHALRACTPGGDS
jgi:tRNA G18 (ribose-2'-O)-methylase SpoU